MQSLDTLPAMETTLLRRPTRELELLAWSRQLKPVKFDDMRALRFLSNAMFSLHQARGPERTPSGRYVIAHEGIYALCLGSMYLHGLLPVGKEGQKELVVQLGLDALLVPTPTRNLVLTSRKLLATATTQAIDSIDDADVRDLVAIGQFAVERARRIYPDWFA